MANTREQASAGFWNRAGKGIYFLLEMPMLVLDKLTVDIRDSMPRFIKERFPVLACREYSLYFEPKVLCKVGRRYNHKGLMKIVCSHYCINNGACGKYCDDRSQQGKD